ncbi:MAG: fumarylacetoacetate hydrolase family protein [Microbacteriaceae bacterium]
MKLVRYEHNGFVHPGVVFHDRVQSLPEALDILDVVRMPAAERDLLVAQAGRHFRAPVEQVRLLPPVEPRAMRDFVAFEGHISGMKKGEPGDGTVPEQWYQAPAFLFMNPWSLYGARDEIPMPPLTSALDFELEVAIIVKDTVRDLSVEEAAEHIAGYTILNDWSARDIQAGEMRVGLGPSKGKDFANTLGPWLVTPDELEQYREGDRLALAMTVAVNGEVIGEDNLRNLSWSFEELLAHASRGAVVGAGDVLGTGTASRGALCEFWSRSGERTPPPLEVGDVVTMTVEGLGSISNRIGPVASPGHTVPRARRTYGEDRL